MVLQSELPLVIPPSPLFVRPASSGSLYASFLESYQRETSRRERRRGKNRERGDQGTVEALSPVLSCWWQRAFLTTHFIYNCSGFYKEGADPLRSVIYYVLFGHWHYIRCFLRSYRARHPILPGLPTKPWWPDSPSSLVASSSSLLEGPKSESESMQSASKMTSPPPPAISTNSRFFIGGGATRHKDGDYRRGMAQSRLKGAEATAVGRRLCVTRRRELCVGRKKHDRSSYEVFGLI
jgi:hypothetical protein